MTWKRFNFPGDRSRHGGSNADGEGHDAHSLVGTSNRVSMPREEQMSACGYKRTFGWAVIYVCFNPESGHPVGGR